MQTTRSLSPLKIAEIDLSEKCLHESTQVERYAYSYTDRLICREINGHTDRKMIKLACKNKYTLITQSLLHDHL